MLLDGTDFASDLAAPLESTVAVDTRLGRAGLVTTAAAQQLATLHPRGSAVAHSASSAQRSSRSIWAAIIRRLFGVDQILASRRFDAWHFRNNCFPIVS